MNRRGFVLAGLGFSLSTLLACEKPASPRSLLLSAYQHHQGKTKAYGIAVADDRGKLRFTLPLAARIHQTLLLNAGARPDAEMPKECLAIARRPGIDLYHVDIETGRLINTIRAKDSRHFFGHACQSASGHVFVPQNHIDKKAASIAVYDPSDHWRLIDELSLPGIGPHQIECLADGKTLAIAMGGIYTHPQTGRKKLNIESMQSSLLYFDSHSAKPIDEFYPPDPKLSLRHMALTSSDRLIIAAQYQGVADTVLPLAYSHQGEEQLQAFRAEPSVWLAHQQYVGSVSVDPNGECVFLSSPRAGLLSRWDLNSLTLSTQFALRDACGLAYSKAQKRFYMSNGRGQLMSSNLHQQVNSQINALGFEPSIIWDNHLTVLI